MIIAVLFLLAIAVIISYLSIIDNKASKCDKCPQREWCEKNYFACFRE